MVRRSNRPPRSCPASPASRQHTTISPRMTARGPPTFDDGASQILQAHVEVWGSCLDKMLMRERQAGSGG
jgi:hypothetical protein